MEKLSKKLSTIMLIIIFTSLGVSIFYSVQKFSSSQGTTDSASFESIEIDTSSASSAAPTPSPTATPTPPPTPAPTPNPTPYVAFKPNLYYATDDIIAHYSEYYEFTEQAAPELLVKIIFATNTTVTDVKFCTGYIDNDSLSFQISQELYSIPQLTKEKPFVITMVFEGSMPTRGITLTDGAGKQRVFSITASGKDGSLVLVDERKG